MVKACCPCGTGGECIAPTLVGAGGLLACEPCNNTIVVTGSGEFLIDCDTIDPPTITARKFDATIAPIPATPTPIEDMRVFYQASFFPGGVTPCSSTNPTPAAIAAVAAQINALPAGSHVMLDIEHTYPFVASCPPGSESVLHYVIDTLRSQITNGAQLAFYGLPLRSYWGPVQPGSTTEANWQAINDSVQTLIDKQDFIAPSIYTLYTDGPNEARPWKETQAGGGSYAAGMIAEAYRVANGKPVYPILWPEYHPNAGVGSDQYLPYTAFLEQLECACCDADGWILWNEPGTPSGSGVPWWDAVDDHLTNPPDCGPVDPPTPFLTYEYDATCTNLPTNVTSEVEAGFTKMNQLLDCQPDQLHTVISCAPDGNGAIASAAGSNPVNGTPTTGIMNLYENEFPRWGVDWDGCATVMHEIFHILTTADPQYAPSNPSSYFFQSSFTYSDFFGDLPGTNDDNPMIYFDGPKVVAEYERWFGYPSPIPLVWGDPYHFWTSFYSDQISINGVNNDPEALMSPTAGFDRVFSQWEALILCDIGYCVDMNSTLITEIPPNTEAGPAGYSAPFSPLIPPTPPPDWP